MRKLVLFLGYFLFLSFIAAQISFAQTGPTPVAAAGTEDVGESLLFMSIPSVFSASKVEESIYDAPNAVTYYDRNDMQNTGYYTLGELASVTPGYSTYPIYGEEVLETRGQKAGSFNDNKHLVFVDGIPVNHGRANMAPIDEQLPLYFADHVEFLRGPASSLYGVSAFYGVISITPQDLKNNGTKFEQRVSLGTNNNNRQILSNLLDRSDSGETKFSFGYYSKEPSKMYNGPYPLEDNRYWDSQKSLFLYGSHEVMSGPLTGFTPGLIVMSKDGGMGEFWDGPGYPGSSEFDDLFWQEVIPYLKYKKDLGIGVLNSYAKVNYSEEKGKYPDDPTVPSGPLDTYDSNVYDYEGSVELNSDLGDKFSWINGFDYDARSEHLSESANYSNSLLLGLPYSHDEIYINSSIGFVYTEGFYSQLRKEFGQFLKGTIFTLGARLDHGSVQKINNSYSQLSPRVGVVQRLTDNWSLRVSDGKAIRAPGIKEIGLNVDDQPAFNYPLAKLVPEKINSLEAGVNYHDDKMQSSLTVFEDRTTDPLDGISVTDNNNQPANIFINGSHIKATGIEFDTKLKPISRLSLDINASYAKTKGDDPAELVDIPTTKVNGIITYDFKFPINFKASLIDRWIASYTTEQGVPTNKGSNLYDMNFVVPAGDKYTFELQVKNLFDKRGFVPQSEIPDVPLLGRSVTASVEIKF